MRIENIRNYITENKENFGYQEKDNPLNYIVKIKFFDTYGAASWYITEVDELTDKDIYLFGFCNLGDEELAEFGSVSLNELLNLKFEFRGNHYPRVDIDNSATGESLKECLEMDGFNFNANSYLYTCYKKLQKKEAAEGRER